MSFGKSIVCLDEIDWAAVARAYKIIRLFSNRQEGNRPSAELSDRYYDWVASNRESAEFGIAVRMVFDESVVAENSNSIIEQILPSISE